MRLNLLVIFVLLTVLGIAQNQIPSIDTLTKHVYYLASDELKGRATGEEGQRKAAKYIANQFKYSGLKPFNSQGFYHYYELKRLHKNKLVVKSNSTMLVWPWHFYFVSGTNQRDTITTQLLFAGYGTEPELQSLDPKGKAIAVLAESPQKAYETIRQISATYDNKTFFVIFPKRNKQVDMNWGTQFQMSSFDLPQKFDNRKLQLIQEEWANVNDSLNIYYCFPNVLRNLFMLDDKGLEKVAKNNMNENYELLASIISPEITCSISYNDSTESIQVENVGAWIRGEDTTKTVVVSAHYDHIGEEMGMINYGADDNASGIAALLESARLMVLDAEIGLKPKTNVLFLAFSGEEIGLLGSKAFVSDSSTRLNSIKFNINMDMLGRWDEKHEQKRDFVYLLAVGDQSKELYNIGKRDIDTPKGFNLNDKPGGREKVIFKYGSDHYSFLEKDISVAVFFTGLHDDYHTPGDTPDKINYDNLTNITSVIYQYIYRATEIE